MYKFIKRVMKQSKIVEEGKYFSKKATNNTVMNDELREKDLFFEPLNSAQVVSIGEYEGGALDRVRSVVEYVQDAVGKAPDLFVECLSYEHHKSKEWHEVARWVKFKETAEHDGHRWSKPHVGILNMGSLLQVKHCLRHGSVVLDASVESFFDVVDLMIQELVVSTAITASTQNRIRQLLLAKKRHLFVRHRVAEASVQMTDFLQRKRSRQDLTVLNDAPAPPSPRKLSNASQASMRNKPSFSADDALDMHDEPFDDNDGKVKLAAKTLTAPVDISRSRKNSLLAVDRDDLDRISIASGQLSVSSRQRTASNTSMSRVPSKLTMVHMMKKLRSDTEGAIIMILRASSLRCSASVFLRLTESESMADEIEVEVPVRYFVLLAAPDNQHEAHHSESSMMGMANALGALLSDEVFRHVALGAHNSTDLAFGVDEFIRSMALVPPGKLDPDQHMEPPEKQIEKSSPERLGIETEDTTDHDLPVTNKSAHEHSLHHNEGLVRTGKWFGGLRDDFKRKWVHYKSDYMDVINPWGNLPQVLAASLVMYFALMANLMTFAVSTTIDEQLGIIEMLMAGSIVGCLYAVFSGQPLTVVSATIEVQLFDEILYHLIGNTHSFLPARFWLSFWACLILLVMVATDMTAIVAWVTMYSEEVFATLVAILFIVHSFQKLAELQTNAPVVKDFDAFWNDTCKCSNATAGGVHGAPVHSTLFQTHDEHEVDSHHDGPVWHPTQMSFDQFMKECHDEHYMGSEGGQCTFKPNVYLYSLILFFSTFLIVWILQQQKKSRFLTSTIRRNLASYGIVIAIVLMTFITWVTNFDVEKMLIPDKFKPTDGRAFWIVNPFDVDPWWTILVMIFPAMFFAILVFMEHQVTSVIVNKRENKLRKGVGYNLDLTVIALLLPLSGIMGIQFMVAATALCMAHVESLRVESDNTAPGEKPVFLGLREQRVSSLLASVAIGFSVLLVSVKLIDQIPKAVMFGIFLYMGYSTLTGQIIDRLLLLITPPKYQPDYPYLRTVKMSKVHLYTAIQLGGLGMLFAIKSVHFTNSEYMNITFPIFLILFVASRHLLPYIYTSKELHALDHPLPTWTQLNQPKTTHKMEMDNGSGDYTNEVFTIESPPVNNEEMSDKNGELLNGTGWEQQNSNPVFVIDDHDSLNSLGD